MVKRNFGFVGAVNSDKAVKPLMEFDRSRDPTTNSVKSNIMLTPKPNDSIVTYPEIEYKGKCFGHKCFIYTEDEPYGQCDDTKHLIAVDLAQRQRLCDHKTDEVNS